MSAVVEDAQGQFEAILGALLERHGSDVHLKVGRPPLFRLSGQIVASEFEPLTEELVRAMVCGSMSDSHRARFESDRAVDFSYSFGENVRFRINAFYERGLPGAVLRAVPGRVPSLDQLRLPAVLSDLSLTPSGLVLVCGPTGSGKSTTLAAMVEHVNQQRQVHIVTLEDPIEFVYTDHHSLVRQREIGTDAPDFATALRQVLREDPDVILIGEMRDPETITTAITAAETGHLVFSTLHTNDAGQTIDRIIDAFPVAQQRQVRIQLAQVLRGVVSQRLLPRASQNGRVVAAEIMTSSPQTQKIIMDGETHLLRRVIEESGGYYRMQSLNQALGRLVAKGRVTFDTACAASPDADELQRLLRQVGYELPK